MKDSSNKLAAYKDDINYLVRLFLLLILEELFFWKYTSRTF